MKRRQHRTEVTIKTDTDYDECDSDSSESTDTEGKCLQRQDAVYGSESNSEESEDSSFSFVRYFNAESSEDTLDSFIDHGGEIEQPKIPQIVTETEPDVVPENSKLTLAVINQISGESASSFETTTKPYMACEDLLNIDESTEINLLNGNKYIPRTRHSLPTKFVGNKFNKSSMTMVYIPHWSNSESNIAKSSSRSISKSESNSSDEDTTTTHSSCLDVPANPIPVPDAMVAEILYNFEPESEQVASPKDKTSFCEEDVLTPPIMFRNERNNSSAYVYNYPSTTEDRKMFIDSATNFSLQFSNIGFRKHSFNSDKRLSNNKENFDKAPSENIEKTAAKMVPKKREKVQNFDKETNTDGDLPSEKKYESKTDDDEGNNNEQVVLSEENCSKIEVEVIPHQNIKPKPPDKPPVLPKPKFTEIPPSSKDIDKNNLEVSELVKRSKSRSLERQIEKDIPQEDNENTSTVLQESKFKPRVLYCLRKIPVLQVTGEAPNNDNCSENLNKDNSVISVLAHLEEQIKFSQENYGKLEQISSDDAQKINVNRADSSSNEISLQVSSNETPDCNFIRLSSSKNDEKQEEPKISSNFSRPDSSKADDSLEPKDPCVKRRSSHGDLSELPPGETENLVRRRRSSHEEASPLLSRRELELFSKLKRQSSHEDHLPNVTQNKTRKSNSLRKCVSYHYLQIGRKPSCTFSPYCRCCTEPCFSRRSSDSGMAGSCTLNSPDLAIAHEENEPPRFPEREHYSLVDMPNLYQSSLGDLRNVSYLEMEAKDFEAQCRCTSPFDSTPRTSCQASTSDNILIETRDSSGTSVTSSCSDMSPFPIPQPWESENQIHEKIMSVKSQQNQSQASMKLPATSKSKSCDNIELRTQRNEQEIFRSGLYAHWWMKAKLPISVIKGIVEENSSAAGKGLMFALRNFILFKFIHEIICMFCVVHRLKLH